MDFDFITQQMKDLGTSSVPSMQVVSPTHRHLPSWVPGIDFASLDSFHWIDHEAPCPPIPTGRSQGSICRLQVWKLIHLQHFYVGEPSPALTKEENPMQFIFNRRYPKDTWRWMSVCWFLRFLLFGEVLVFICPGGSPLSLEARDFGTFHGENWNLASCFGRVVESVEVKDHLFGSSHSARIHGKDRRFLSRPWYLELGELSMTQTYRTAAGATTGYGAPSACAWTHRTTEKLWQERPGQQSSQAYYFDNAELAFLHLASYLKAKHLFFVVFLLM